MSSHESIDVLVRMQGKRQYIKDTAEVAGATRALDQSIDRVGRSADKTARRSFLMNQALFTARRLTYDFTLAAGAAGIAVAFLGLKFNTMMETNTIALGYLLGGEQAATKELEYLYELAAKTPFAFGELTDVARRFLAFGFTVQQTNRYLAATADTMAAMGGNPEVMQRLVRAFGQIQAKGRLYAEEVLQLTEVGIPAYKYLQQQLGLTGDQMARIGELGIPAAVAIEALVRGLEADPSQGGFAGAAEELQTSVAGQLNTIKDYAYQLFGEIMMAPFEAIRDNLPQLSDTLGKATEAMKTKGFMAMIAAFDEGAGAGGKLVMVVDYLRRTIGNLVIIFRTSVLPVFQVYGFYVLAILVPALVALDKILGFLAQHGEALSFVVLFLTTRWAAYRLMTLAVWLVNTKLLMGIIWLGRAMWILALRMKAARMGMILIWGTMALLTKATLVARAAWAAFMVLMVAYRTGAIAAAAATVLLNIALWANPVVLIVAGIVILVYALFRLEQRFGFARKAVVWLWDKIVQFYNWLKNNKDALWNLIPGVAAFNAAKWGLGKAAGALGFADGGNISAGGWARVGERGPELVYLPAGASVQRNRAMSLGGRDGPSVSIHITPAPVMLDGREVAEVVFNHQQDRFARA